MPGPHPASGGDPTPGRAVTKRYRLRMRGWARVLRVLLFSAILVFFLPAVLAPSMEPGWRVLAVAGVVSSILSLRYVVGTAVEARHGGLRVLTRWPLWQDIPWHRILENDVVPGVWNLELELVDGERVDLPCVERVDDLYATIEARRHDLGS